MHWILWTAPVGIFALAAPVIARSGWDMLINLAVFIVAVGTLGPLGDRGAVLGVLAATVGLAVEGLFLERVSHRQVMPTLPAARPSRRVPAGGSVSS